MTNPGGPDGFDLGPLQKAVSIFGAGTNPAATGSLSQLPQWDQATAEALLKQLFVKDNPSINDPLARIYSGLREGISLPLAVLESLINRFMGTNQLFLSVEHALSFAKKVPVLSEFIELLTGVEDGDENDLATWARSLLGPDSPLNANNIFGRFQLAQFGGGVPIMSLTTATPNELQPFSAESVPNNDGWSFNAAENSAQVVCDGTTKGLYLRSGVIKVEQGQPINTLVKAKYSGVTSGPGQTIRYVLETFETADGSGPATPVVVAAITNPSGTISTPVTLGDTSWDVPAGVQSVRPVLVVDGVTAGTVYWLNTPQLRKILLGVLADGIAAAIQARIDALNSLLNSLWTNPASVLGTLPQSLVEGLLDLKTILEGIRDILGGLPTVPTLPILQDIKDWFTGNNAKTQNLSPTGTLDPVNVGGIAAPSILEDIQNTWNKFWDGIKGTTGSTGKTPDDVLTAAAAVSSAATSAQQSTDTLSGYFNTPRLVPAWMGVRADDVAFDVDKIDGTTAPTLGQIVLIPIVVQQDRIYDAIKFGIADITMTNCYVGLYATDLLTGDLAKVIDLGDCKSQLNTLYNQQTVPLPVPISVQRGEVYYIAVLQVGGSAAGMHRSSLTTNFSTGLYPRYRGNVYGLGGQSALPSTITVGNVASSTRYWGALGTAADPVTPGAVYLSDSFNRPDSTSLGSSWSTRAGTGLRITSNEARPGRGGTFDTMQDGFCTFNTRLTSLSQSVKFRVGSFIVTSTAPNTGPQTVSYATFGLRGDGLGRMVVGSLRLFSGENGGSRTVYAHIHTATSYANIAAGTWTTRANATVGSNTTAFAGDPEFEFNAIGSTYSILKNGTVICQWVDSGGIYPVTSTCTELGLGAVIQTSNYASFNEWKASDL